MAQKWSEAYQFLRETHQWIREQQQHNAYAFPTSFAPDGRLAEAVESGYMRSLRQYYQYGKSTEDLVLELRQEENNGGSTLFARVGEVYSADFFWTKEETIRLNIVASWNQYLEHYNVFDIGNAGIALSVPKIAWDNWRMWNAEKMEGADIDKRFIYLAIGDRSKIRDMTVEEFGRLSYQQIQDIHDSFRPGMVLTRPTMAEAGLEVPEKEEKKEEGSPPPVVELSSSSSSGSGTRSPSHPSPRASSSSSRKSASKGESSKADRSYIMTRGRLGRGGKKSSKPVFQHQGPDGPLSQETVDRVQAILTSTLKPPTPSAERMAKAEAQLAELRVSSKRKSSESSITTFEEETSVEESRNCSGMFDISGVSSLEGSLVKPRRMSSSDIDGPLPMDDSVEVFLVKKIPNDLIHNVSTDSSVLGASKGKVSDSSVMEI